VSLFPRSCPICSVGQLEVVFEYHAPPVGETRFAKLEGRPYHRVIATCGLCRHHVSVLHSAFEELYDEEYVSSTYGDEKALSETFQRITALPAGKSDNAGRVERVERFADRFLDTGSDRSLLDIGSGLAVFPWAMKRAGWNVTALDPDKRAVDMARDLAGVKAERIDFLKDSIDCEFALVTLNKVLEHVLDPVKMLSRAGELLRVGGFLYLEVPDAEAAAVEGMMREEFFIEHFHIFSAPSLLLAADRAALRVLVLERILEPSGKFTLFGCFQRKAPTCQKGL
jgi:2-polyprenyl-3-methyl-5-hydroxy-6-metoxy-1,4-benzoquinol methylase